MSCMFMQSDLQHGELPTLPYYVWQTSSPTIKPHHQASPSDTCWLCRDMLHRHCKQIRAYMHARVCGCVRVVVCTGIMYVCRMQVYVCMCVACVCMYAFTYVCICVFVHLYVCTYYKCAMQCCFAHVLKCDSGHDEHAQVI